MNTNKHPQSIGLFQNSKMNEQEIIRGNFLRAFVNKLIKNMVSAGMVNGVYPDIEKIKQNIKIYEKPGSNLANAIIMNQSPEVQKLMQPYDLVKENLEGETNIPSIKIEGEEEFSVPFPVSIRKPIIQKKNMMGPGLAANFGSPISHPMPFTHQKVSMRMLPSNLKSNLIVQNPVTIKPMPVTPEKTTIIGLDKLDKILTDASVQTVECPGPNKQILVYKSGVIQTANLTLTSDEIKNIMKDISDKTRIPLMSGVFKAAYGNLIITAVMSEFVGTRFIMQKKPQMQPQAGSFYQQ